MARKIQVYSNPGYSNPKLVLTVEDDDPANRVQTESINLSPAVDSVGAELSGWYEGVPTAPAGTYYAALIDDVGDLGAWPNVALAATADEVTKLGDPAATPDDLANLPQYGDDLTLTHRTSADTIPATLTKD